ncbi:hypothetical protein LTR17_016828 [Elasticomyces elasticus]|nr:hypothetical protein LTR17_016828 [Elasticomyces elasticus]
MTADSEEEGAAPASNAALKVFGTVELAEMIFLGLSMRDVLTSTQRVCREWKGIIDGSIPIQQALFQKPINEVKLQYYDNSEQGGRWGKSANAPHSFSMVQHPLMAWMTCGAKEPGGQPRTYYNRFTGLCIKHPDGSWRKALVTQPAVSEIALSPLLTSYGDPSTPVLLTGSNGATLGDLAYLGRQGENILEAKGLRKTFFAVKGGRDWLKSDLALEELRVLRSRMLRTMRASHDHTAQVQR